MSTPQEKFEKLANDLAAQPNIMRAKMFGMPCAKVNGNTFIGFYKDAMTFKLTGKAHGSALKLKGARLFDPSGMGRAMKEWVEVPAAHSARWKTLAQAALAYVSTLPAK